MWGPIIYKEAGDRDDIGKYCQSVNLFLPLVLLLFHLEYFTGAFPSFTLVLHTIFSPYSHLPLPYFWPSSHLSSIWSSKLDFVPQVSTTLLETFALDCFLKLKADTSNDLWSQYQCRPKTAKPNGPFQRLTRRPKEVQIWRFQHKQSMWAMVSSSGKSNVTYNFLKLRRREYVRSLSRASYGKLQIPMSFC